MRVGPLAAASDVLADFGRTLEDACRASGVSARLLRDPDSVISFEDCGRFLQAGAALSGAPHFGLLVGVAATPSSLGLVGFLAQHAPTVRSALANLSAFMHHQGRGLLILVDEKDDVVTLNCMVLHAQVTGLVQTSEMALGVAWTTLKAICGPDWRAIQVYLSRSRPEEAGPYRNLLEAPVRFDSEEAGIEFPTSWLDRPVPGSDKALYRFLRGQIEAAEELTEHSMSEEVSRIIRTRLQDSDLSVDAVAAAMSFNRRTLSRRLAAEGVSFSSLLAAVRYDVAKRLLRSTAIPLSEIALSLGYSEASAFTRAFREWSGASPQQWRTDNQSPLARVSKALKPQGAVGASPQADRPGLTPDQ
ncbi:AraC family transcriptional regulator [Alsobacter sp. SYSU BS001988]|jgi:AraC-like DNA-binding protein